jgi:hypothetical protein
MTDQAARTGPWVRPATGDASRQRCARAALWSPGFGLTR